ncbi:hypothetical protein FIBSPDRAFT_854913 [Athelia psychrophila]|uniref:Uncharacterized protein n=1 Tax=Athelia psychrophila TaxID=1759441 RepID=A0A166PNN1_9AGAM|nr:hypothetical protein FIBSPDRAFT_854913 [Fibularhizoctonia sp. CBS 109695]
MAPSTPTMLMIASRLVLAAALSCDEALLPESPELSDSVSGVMELMVNKESTCPTRASPMTLEPV